MCRTTTAIAILGVLAMSNLPAQASGIWLPNGTHINGLMSNGFKFNGGGANGLSFGPTHVIQITAVELPPAR